MTAMISSTQMHGAAPVIGAMPMPSNFRYRDVFAKGMPVHDGWDTFTLKHPPMPVSRWAKIFSPFDALKGFNEAIRSKEEIFERRHDLDEDEKRDLNRKLSILHNYAYNNRMARANHIMVTITNFIPKDPSGSFGNSDRGRYIDTAGMVLSVDEIKETVTLDTQDGKVVIDFENILEVEPAKQDLFDEAEVWEDSI